MYDNILYKLTLHIDVSLTLPDIEDLVIQSLSEMDFIYSYLVYNVYKDNKLTGWQVQYNISQVERYNVLSCKEVIDGILQSISEQRNVAQRVLDYKQPSLDVMLQVYQPLINKLAREQHERWQHLEYEDLVSMCQLTMVKLYNKGYYVHKSLLTRSFQHDVLLMLRGQPYNPDLVSIEQPMPDTGDEQLTVGDTIRDISQEERQVDEEDRAMFDSLFQAVKRIVVTLYGERQFDQLLREYGNKHTTDWSRRRMQRIKSYFSDNHITKKSLEDKL